MPLPWSAASHLPVINNALPFRFTAYVSLAAAVIVALWIATTKGRIFARPYVLPILAVVALVPAVWRTDYPSYHASQPARLAFFTDGLYKSCIPRNETLAIFPFGPGGTSLLSQAETGFWFRLAEDGLQAPNQALNSFDAERIVYELNYMANRGRPTMGRLLAFAATHDVGRVISVAGDGYPTPAQMRSFGSTERIGGVTVSPACGQPPLTQRDLASYVKADPYEVINAGAECRLLPGSHLQRASAGALPGRASGGGKTGDLRCWAGSHLRSAAARIQAPRLRHARHERACGHLPALFEDLGLGLGSLEHDQAARRDQRRSRCKQCLECPERPVERIG